MIFNMNFWQVRIHATTTMVDVATFATQGLKVPRSAHAPTNWTCAYGKHTARPAFHTQTTARPTNMSAATESVSKEVLSATWMMTVETTRTKMNIFVVSKINILTNFVLSTVILSTMTFSPSGKYFPGLNLSFA